MTCTISSRPLRYCSIALLLSSCAGDMGARLRDAGFLRVHPAQSRLAPGSLVYLGGSAEAPVLKVACWVEQAFPRLPDPMSLRDPVAATAFPRETTLEAPLLAALRGRHRFLQTVKLHLSEGDILGHDLAALDTYRDRRQKQCLAALAKLKKEKQTVYGVVRGARATVRYLPSPKPSSGQALALASDLLGAPHRAPKPAASDPETKRSTTAPLIAKGAYVALYLQPLDGGAMTILEVGSLHIKTPLTAKARAELIRRPIWVDAEKSLADTMPKDAPKTPKVAEKAAGHGH